MIKITLFVKYENKREDFIEKGSFSIERPETYEDLIKKIKIKFNINDDDFAVRIFDEDMDEDINVNYDEQYNDPKYKSQTNYKVLLEESPSRIDENIFEFIDKTLNLKNDLLIDENEIFDKFDFSTNSSGDINLGLSVTELKNENLKEEQTEKNELYNYFLDDFSKKLSSQTEEKKNLFIESINKDLINIDNVINENVDKFNKKTKIYSDKINLLHNEINELKSIIIYTENNEEEKEKDKKEEERKRREEEEKKSEKLEIKSQEKYVVEKANTSDILVQVKVKNISEKKISFKNKKWVKGKKSNEAVDFLNGLDKININDDIGINEEKDIDVHLSIKEPKSKQNYKVELSIGSVKDNNEIKIITENALFFDIEITEKDPPDPNALTPERIEEIYNYFEENFVISTFMDKEAVIAKIIEMNGDMQKLTDFVEKEI